MEQTLRSVGVYDRHRSMRAVRLATVSISDHIREIVNDAFPVSRRCTKAKAAHEFIAWTAPVIQQTYDTVPEIAGTPFNGSIHLREFPALLSARGLRKLRWPPTSAVLRDWSAAFVCTQVRRITDVTVIDVGNRRPRVDGF